MHTQIIVLIITLIIVFHEWIGHALHVILVYVILPLVVITVAFHVIRAIYHFFNPKAKEAFKVRKAKEEKAWRRQEAKEAEIKRKEEEKQRVEQKALKDREEAEQRKKIFEHSQHRDGEKQSRPYKYKIGNHGNESLAIRYGIANQERKTKEYWYHAKGGVKKRNPERDKVYYESATSIQVQKTRKISADLYEVLLTDYRNRKARAVIEVGTEYVKTFYPLDDVWFKKHADLEQTLKGNGTFTLKELATFHVQKTVGS